jgi:hypothetical protein
MSKTTEPVELSPAPIAVVSSTLLGALVNSDRRMNATVEVQHGDGVQRYKASVWRDGTIAFRPIA